jgi:hypothetical protein
VCKKECAKRVVGSKCKQQCKDVDVSGMEQECKNVDETSCKVGGSSAVLCASLTRALQDKCVDVPVTACRRECTKKSTPVCSVKCEGGDDSAALTDGAAQPEPGTGTTVNADGDKCTQQCSTVEGDKICKQVCTPRSVRKCSKVRTIHLPVTSCFTVPHCRSASPSMTRRIAWRSASAWSVPRFVSNSPSFVCVR